MQAQCSELCFVHNTRSRAQEWGGAQIFPLSSVLCKRCLGWQRGGHDYSGAHPIEFNEAHSQVSVHRIAVGHPSVGCGGGGESLGIQAHYEANRGGEFAHPSLILPLPTVSNSSLFISNLLPSSPAAVPKGRPFVYVWKEFVLIAWGPFP